MDERIKQDPRWLRLHDPNYVCPHCGGIHGGLTDVECIVPTGWDGGTEKAPNSEIHAARHLLTIDFCIIEGEHFLIRCVLPIAVTGLDEAFGIGVWVELSAEHFQTYLATFDEDQGHLGPWPGRLANEIFGFADEPNMGYLGTLGHECLVRLQDGGDRPLVELARSTNLLSIEQHQGHHLRPVAGDICSGRRLRFQRPAIRVISQAGRVRQRGGVRAGATSAKRISPRRVIPSCGPHRA
jgi:hypothetical protein